MRSTRWVKLWVMRTWSRSVLAASLFLAPLVSSAPAQAAVGASDGNKDKDTDKDYDYGAKVAIELRMENGKVVKHRGEMRSFGNEWRFEFDGADHHHLVTLSAEGEEGSKSLEVTFAYERDGTAIIAPYTETFKARKRQAMWTEDGKMAIALTFHPKKFEREDSSRDDEDQIAPDDSDDPLGSNPLN